MWKKHWRGKTPERPAVSAGEIILILLLTGLAFWGIFILAPSLVFLFSVFNGKDEQLMTEEKAGRSYYAPYRQEILAAQERMTALPWQRVTARSDDGLVLAAEYLSRGNRKAVLYVPGFHASPFANFGRQTEDFLARGYDVLCLHERGLGVSGGSHVGMGLWERGDVKVWARWLSKRAEEVVVYGISMGAAAAAYTADSLPDTVKALVVDCGFLSPYEALLYDCQKRRLPGRLLMPVMRVLMKFRFGLELKESVLGPLSRAKMPVLFLHGEADTVVPVSQGKRAFEACRGPKEALFVPGAPHTLCYTVGGEELRETFFAFLARYIQ